jgi:hypothetical protein
VNHIEFLPIPDHITRISEEIDRATREMLALGGRLTRNHNAMVTNASPGPVFDMAKLKAAVDKVAAIPPRMEIHRNLFLTITEEDWSDVRSPSRAKRRRAQGHKQRIRYVQVPDPNFHTIGNQVYGHPVTVQKLLDRLPASDIPTVYGVDYP